MRRKNKSIVNRFVARVLTTIILGTLIITSNVRSATISQLNGSIVSSNWDNHIMLLDMKSSRVIQLTKSGTNLWPTWSFDGKKIAFASVRGEHKREICIMDADGRNEKRVIYTKNGDASDPHWGVGSLLYFETVVKGVLQENSIDLISGDMKVISSTGEVSAKTIKELLEKRKHIYQIFPSRDGKYQMLYFRHQQKLELLELASGTKRELRGGRQGQPSWSKDSKRVAYVTGEIPDQVLMIFDVKENTYEEIHLGRGPDTGCGGKTSWNGSSSRIVYSCGTPYSQKEDSRLYMLDLETKKSSMLIKGSSPDWH